MTMRAALVTVVLALAAAGCGGDEAPAPAGGGGGEPDGRLAAPLQLKVTGGEEGRRDRMTIRPDRTASIETTKGRTTAELSEEELSTVSEQFAGARLADLPEDSLTKPPIPDALAYSLVYQGREVSTDAGSLPARLKPLLGTLLRLLERHGPS